MRRWSAVELWRLRSCRRGGQPPVEECGQVESVHQGCCRICRWAQAFPLCHESLVGFAALIIVTVVVITLMSSHRCRLSLLSHHLISCAMSRHQIWGRNARHGPLMPDDIRCPGRHRGKERATASPNDFEFREGASNSDFRCLSSRFIFHS